MPNTKISALTAGNPAQGTDEIPIARGGANFKVSAASIAATFAGTLAPANGGTGAIATPSNGQLLIGNGTNYSVANLTAGSNISITNSAGGISIAAASGVTTFSAGSTGLLPAFGLWPPCQHGKALYQTFGLIVKTAPSGPSKPKRRAW